MLPDAPEIRDAERYGFYNPGETIPVPICKVCGAIDPDYIYRMQGVAIGCSECIERVEGGDYAVELWEKEHNHE